MSVSREFPMPMYIQLAETIKDEIYRGIIKPGGSIGSQKTLEERFGVSTVTVRRAIQLLENEGLIITKRGKGSYVKPANRLEQHLVHLQSLSEVIQEKGLESKVIINKTESLQVSNPEKKGLPLDFDETCLYIERLHFVENKPMALAVIYLPYYIGEELTIKDLENKSIYELIEKKLGIVLGEAEQTIEACPAEEKVAKLLQVNNNAPLLKVDRITFSEDYKPVEKITFYYRHDVYSFRIKLTRANQITMWPN